MANKLAALVGAMLLAATAQAEWSSSVDEDKFTGETSTTASTHTPGGTPRGSSLLVRCKGTELDVFMSFGYLNLTDADTSRGSVKLKYIFDGGDVRGNQFFEYSQGGDGLFFSKMYLRGLRPKSALWFPFQFIRKNTFSVRLNYYKAGQTDVTFDLKDAAPHIRKVLEACGVSPDSDPNEYVVTEVEGATWLCMVAKDELAKPNEVEFLQRLTQRSFDENCPNAAPEAEYCRIGRKYMRLDGPAVTDDAQEDREQMMRRYCKQTIGTIQQ